MASPSSPPVAWPPTLGDLPFGLAPAELRARAEAALESIRSGVKALADSSDRATVDGFLEPLDRLYHRLQNINAHGGLLFSVATDAETRSAGREVSEAAERLASELRLNAGLYARLRALDLSDAEAPTRFAVEKMLREQRRAGVEGDDAARATTLELLSAIDRTGNRFAENIAQLDRSLLVPDPARLHGLPSDYLAAHPPGPDGRVRITTKYPDFGPVMSYCDDASVRRDLLLEFARRAYPENDPVLRELLELRARFASHLGYASYAAFAIEDKMMATPGAARAFLARLAALLAAPSERDLDRYLARKRRDHPEATTLELWDAESWGSGYYDSKIRTEEYGVDTSRLRTYLPYLQVRNGLFELCRELFGLEFRRADDAEVWHRTVEAFDVTRRGVPLGRCYLDLVPRDGKFNHAACFTVRDGRADVELPQAALVCNFVASNVPQASARMEWRDVVVFFHEFGHLIHHLLAGQPQWLYNGQGRIEWDFIEAPSQLFEEWARDPATLARFAMDPDTGERIPKELLERLRAAEALGRPARLLRQVALATISLDFYEGGGAIADPAAAYHRSWNSVVPRPLPSEYHFEASFGHLGGYSAFYYTYLWSLVIARDLLTPFRERGDLTDPEAARRYAEEILAPGSIRPAAELVRRYLGRDFSYAAFEAWVLGEPVRSSPAAPERARSTTAGP